MTSASGPPDDPAPSSEETLPRPSESGGVPTVPSPRSAGRAPSLFGDTAFWGITATQFLGAFNDNVFKQMLLLLSLTAVAAPIASAGSGTVGKEDLQWVGLFVFALPFVLFSGFAGFLSDRNGKRGVIILVKALEIVVMALGMAGFAAYAKVGLTPLWAVLFLMGMQSAFFGPSKFGILPEMLHRRDLPQANGIILMTTFLAIILGTASGGALKVLFAGRLWLAMSVCVAIATLGTLTSLAVRRLPPANPNLRFELSTLAIPPEIRRLLLRDRPLLAALLASCMFWLIGGLVQPSVNALGRFQFGLDDFSTSAMTTMLAVGIAAGCTLAGILSRGRVNARVVRTGAWGVCLSLGLLALPGVGRPQLLGALGSVPVLLMLGFFAGMFVVPIQVFLQTRPGEHEKGRMIATMSLMNWIAILVSAVLYFVFKELLDVLDLPYSAMFALTALLMLPVAVFYRPPDDPLG